MNDSNASSLDSQEGYDLIYPWLRVKTQPSACCLCEAPVPTETRFSFSVNRVPFTIECCPVHRIMFLSPQPIGDYFDDLYNHPSYYLGTDDMFGLATDEQKSTSIAETRMNELRRRVPEFASLIEIGCAYGHVLTAARAQGVTDVMGIEFSDRAVTVCREKGLPVFLGTMEGTCPEVKGRLFDVLASYSVLEHVPNPCTFLHHILSTVKKGGHVCLRVPIVSIDGPWLSLVDHLWHFTDEGMRNLLSSVGLSVVDSFPSGTFVGSTHPGKLSSVTYIAAMPSLWR